MEEAAGEDEVGFWVLAEICSSDGEDEVGFWVLAEICSSDGEDEVGFWVLAEICSSDGEDEVGGASSGCRKLCSCDFNEIELWLCKAMEEEIDEIEYAS
ncbi:hypothetical protein L3X38_040160 [Prunus dulcis]|uniref:Uncharacterized protein n=1 Tax=Prunus dulcis TaxID=3755 RepID=A0AAD4YS60_PRUDU|nr:hypothetical protein L3X38_040160 [Prunus dulcis]